jgi:hypothetical protein
MSEQLQTLFSGLRATPFRVTSPADRKYNCIAWAANDASAWWWPDGMSPDAVWPDSAARELTLGAFTAAFLTIGYIVGGDESLEPRFEKPALFVAADGTPTHAATSFRLMDEQAWKCRGHRARPSLPRRRNLRRRRF